MAFNFIGEDENENVTFSSKPQLNPLQQLQPYVCSKNAKIALSYMQAIPAYYSWNLSLVYQFVLETFKKEDPDIIVNKLMNKVFNLEIVSNKTKDGYLTEIELF